MRRVLTLFLMAVFVLAVTGTVLANGKGSVDGQKQIGEATAEVALTVIRTTGDDQSAQEIGLTEINQSMQVAFIHAPTGDPNGITKLGADDQTCSQIVNVADTAKHQGAVAVEKTMIETGCVAMFFGWRGSSSPPPLEVALFMGPPVVGSQITA